MGPLPVGRLLVGVDASLPLHRALLLAGLGSSGCRGAWSCCHGAGGTLQGWRQLQLAGQASQQQPNVIKQRAASAASPVEHRITARCSSLEKLLLPGSALKPQHTAAPPLPLQGQIKVGSRAQRRPSLIHSQVCLVDEGHPSSHQHTALPSSGGVTTNPL